MRLKAIAAAALVAAVGLSSAASAAPTAKSKPKPKPVAGSLTISAWINASFFPVDDASIVSTYNGLGYQLDTTVDEGPRTIGFKLTDWTGRHMARSRQAAPRSSRHREAAAPR